MTHLALKLTFLNEVILGPRNLIFLSSKKPDFSDFISKFGFSDLEIPSISEVFLDQNN